MVPKPTRQRTVVPFVIPVLRERQNLLVAIRARFRAARQEVDGTVDHRKIWTAQTCLGLYAIAAVLGLGIGFLSKL